MGILFSDARRFLMSKGVCVVAVFSLLVLLVGAPAARAGYPRSGAILTDADAYVYNPVMIASGRGGAIVAWAQGGGDAQDVYAQRVGALGELLWPPEGVAISEAADDQFSPVMSPDGEGGAIIVWMDQRAGYTHLWAQRVDSTGTVLWAKDGVPVCTAVPGQQMDARILLCAGGDVIITWEDGRSGSYDIYAQRFDGGGNPLWTINGIAVCTAANDQYVPDIVSDDAGGAIVTWEDYRDGNWDIYAQRVDSLGNLLWTANGVAACTDGADQTEPRIASNMTGGAFIAWTDHRSYGIPNTNVYLQDINFDGFGNWYFFPDGAWVATSEYNESTPQIVSDGAGGAIVAWWQDVPGAAGARAQRISEGAQSLWGSSGGVPLCNAYIDREGLRIAPDGAGGIFAAWMDYRNGSADVYVERVDAEGNISWSSNGTDICAGFWELANIELAPDESGGIVVAWADYRFVNYECACAQRVNADGWWGNPEPGILSCLDVPADEGGFARVRLAASSHDVKLERDYPIEGYNVWRMVESSGGAPGALAAGEGSSLERADLGSLMAECLKTPFTRLSRAQALALGFPEGEWESIGFHAATRDSLYNFLVPTKSDSTEGGATMETYLVTAHAPAAGVFVVSNPDSGYSVDNIAPGATPGFAGAETASPPGLKLTWTRNAASDLWKYDVHRGDDALFVPDASNLLESTNGTEIQDANWIKAYLYFYKLVAVDRHGNKSPAALLTPGDIKVGTLLQSFAATLKKLGIEVSWTLSEEGSGAEFHVMRASGANASFEEVASPQIVRDGLSFSLSDGSVEPGTSYRYRVDVVDEAGSRTLFETEAISTPEMPLTLHQNHPNPFNPSTTIGYYMPAAGQVTLDVYDSSGRLVTRLLDRAMKQKGTHSVEWRGLDAQGRSVSSGVYFYRLTSGKETISKKMVLLR
jgi:hypothetical protein